MGRKSGTEWVESPRHARLLLTGRRPAHGSLLPVRCSEALAFAHASWFERRFAPSSSARRPQARSQVRGTRSPTLIAGPSVPLAVRTLRVLTTSREAQRASRTTPLALSAGLGESRVVWESEALSSLRENLDFSLGAKTRSVFCHVTRRQSCLERLRLLTCLRCHRIATRSCWLTRASLS